MSVLNFEQKILLIINEIKRQKLRPDETRICQFILRRYNHKPEETKIKLQALVKDNILYTALYKGAISFRIFSNGTESPSIKKIVQLEKSVNLKVNKRKRVSFFYRYFFFFSDKSFRFLVYFIFN